MASDCVAQSMGVEACGEVSAGHIPIPLRGRQLRHEEVCSRHSSSGDISIAQWMGAGLIGDLHSGKPSCNARGEAAFADLL